MRIEIGNGQSASPWDPDSCLTVEPRHQDRDRTAPRDEEPTLCEGAAADTMSITEVYPPEPTKNPVHLVQQ